MDLPIVLLEAPTPERVISVDGAWSQPGLNLSHWPGNATPAELKHDLSTGIALAFSRLPAARQAELARGCVAIANNHYDTDGVCALFALRHPERALPLAGRLLAAAAAGDFFALPDERAFQVDLIVEGFADEERSPWRQRFAGLSDHDRRELVLREIVARFDEILTGDLERYEDLWRPGLERLRADRAALSAAARDEVAHLELLIVTSAAGGFDPGRHALFGSTSADRVLVVGQRAAGATYRFVIGTRSWFDLVSRSPLPRPSLEALAAKLNELEGADAGARVAWRCQSTQSPSPELWFGRGNHEMFDEHCPALEESRLAPSVVRPLVVGALRDVWAFPESD
jgi:hypothetical protein